MEKTSILVFTAASTQGLLEELAHIYVMGGGEKVLISAGASSTMARQIAEGAPAHVYITARSDWMNYLEGHQLVEEETIKTWLTNDLVLIGKSEKNYEKSLKVLENFHGQLAIGEPNHVPAGVYGMEALEYLGYGEALKNRLTTAVNVRAAVRLVELEEASLGISYASDLTSNTSLEILATFPRESHTPIRYVVARLKQSPDRVEDFLNFLESDKALEIIERHGFKRP